MEGITMNEITDRSWKDAFLPKEHRQGEVIAVGSLAAGVGLFITSMLVILVIGLVAGALVLIEKVANNVLVEDDRDEIQVAGAAAPREEVDAMETILVLEPIAAMEPASEMEPVVAMEPASEAEPFPAMEPLRAVA
jgi:hypothetical protein